MDDSDWVWQGYPQLNLVSTLPNWLTWKTRKWSGVVKWESSMVSPRLLFFYRSKSGNEKIYQNFDLTIIVDDYPPRIQNSDDESINKKFSFLIEDGSMKLLKTLLMAFLLSILIRLVSL